MDLDANLIIQKLLDRIKDLELENAILKVQNDVLIKEINELGEDSE